MRVIQLTLFLAATLATALAGPIPGLINTGATVSTGSPDPNWAILSPAQQAVAMDHNPAWLPNDATSKWVWENADGLPVNVTRTFRTSFDLTGFDPSSASIRGRWATDNFGLDILINNIPVGQSSGGFGDWSNFLITFGFQPGINTLDFIVRDFGVVAGFRAEFLSSFAKPLPVTVIPEPASAGLMLVGVAAATLLLRR